MKAILLLTAVYLLGSSTANAQRNRANLGIGDQVRFTLALDTANKVYCEAQVSRLTTDTVVVRAYGRCALPDVAFWNTRDLEVERKKGSRFSHTVKGIGLG